MADVTSGGKSKAYIFPVKYDSATGGYDFYDTTGAEQVAPTTTHAFVLDEILKTPPSFTEEGTVDIEWEQMDSGKSLDAFLDMVAVPAGTTAGLPSYKLENGVEKGGSSGSSGYQVVILSYLQTDEDTSEVKVLIALGGIAATSGSYETNPEDYNKVSVSFVGSKSEAAITISADMFDSAIVDTTSAATTIASGKAFVRHWLAEAA